MVKKGITPEKAKEIRERKGMTDETKLQKLRVEKGLSQKGLSVISGVTVRSIQCYEQRTRQIDTAKLKTLCDLAIALDCKIPDILEEQTLIDRFNMVK